MSDMNLVSYMDVDKDKYFFQKWSSLVSINVLWRSVTLQVCFVLAKNTDVASFMLVRVKHSVRWWERKPAVFALCSTWMDSMIHTAENNTGINPY